MIKQVFNVKHYWKVIVYYDVDYNFLDGINKELYHYGFSKEPLDEMWYMLKVEKVKAVTCSNIYKNVSFVIFNKHHSKSDYINSIIHEAEHVKQAMLEAYNIKDSGELPAYTIGYLVMRMYEVFKEYFFCKD